MLDINRQLASGLQFDPALMRCKRARWQMNAKRLLDIGGAGFGLLLLSPLFAVVALLIKLDSSGPVFFRQHRTGFNHEPFRILKFRTMTTMEDDANVAQARMVDERVTRVGCWLRRSNIDELPQLLNVLCGEMSLVGPRPHALSHDFQFGRKIAFYALRHNMKPGITGWAQVNGFRGPILADDQIRNRVEHDVFYIQHWSFWFDVRILWLTFASLDAHRNAY